MPALAQNCFIRCIFIHKWAFIFIFPIVRWGLAIIYHMGEGRWRIVIVSQGNISDPYKVIFSWLLIPSNWQLIGRHFSLAPPLHYSIGDDPFNTSGNHVISPKSSHPFQARNNITCPHNMRIFGNYHGYCLLTNHIRYVCSTVWRTKTEMSVHFGAVTVVRSVQVRTVGTVSATVVVFTLVHVCYWARVN